MKVSKTNNRFKTGFSKSITGLPKKPILTSLIYIYIHIKHMSIYMHIHNYTGAQLSIMRFHRSSLQH